MPSLPALLDIVGRTVCVYLVILLAIRLAGKRHVGQLSIPDVVLILLISNAVQNAMVGPDTSLAGGLAAAVALVLVNLALSAIVLRSRRARGLLEGSPVLLIYDGRVLDERLAREGISREELAGALREHGIDAPSEVHTAVLELDGTISIVPRSAAGEPLRSTVRRRRTMRRSRA